MLRIKQYLNETDVTEKQIIHKYICTESVINKHYKFHVILEGTVLKIFCKNS